MEILEFQINLIDRFEHNPSSYRQVKLDVFLKEEKVIAEHVSINEINTHNNAQHFKFPIPYDEDWVKQAFEDWTNRRDQTKFIVYNQKIIFLVLYNYFMKSPEIALFAMLDKSGNVYPIIHQSVVKQFSEKEFVQNSYILLSI